MNPFPSETPTLDKIPTLDLRDYLSSSAGSPERRSFVQTLGAGLQRFGFIVLEGHDVGLELISSAYDRFRAFFDLPDEVKKRYSGAAGGARGYTPFGIEHAKDHAQPDLKEFWQIGQQLPEGHPLRAEYIDNVWPAEVPGFEEKALEIFRKLESCSVVLLRALAEFFELPRETFADMIVDGNHVLRVIHYPPLGESAVPGSLRAAPHEDINLITLLCEATDGGLELFSEGEWIPVVGEPGQIVVDSGDMLARVTNDVVPATTHRVVNPPSAEANRSRYSIPFFTHPFPACDLTALDRFIEPGGKAKFSPITAGEYLDERLREIGLKS